MKVTGNWERIRALFHAALEQPAEARAAFLSSACQDDESLRREVESLLAAHGTADGFLESPAINLDGGRVAVASPELQPGDQVGNFEVIGSLGAGGMGEVYRARDAKLRREVAIKLLPRALADDPQRLARFERESRILAALNHPHIATIHSVEHADTLHALVMELVEGPTLADRLNHGRLEWPDALALARELASALEAAHDKGVVHRDLKPANIKFSSSGSLKLLDFGLAKEHAEHEPAGAPSSRQPTDALKTTDGWVFGTCAYMSPEQARGLPVDKRTDIWAFGCLLFEILTGRRAFDGATVSETVAAVLEREPDWAVLPNATPHTVRRLLRRCLEKDPHRRLHDIADARIEIDDALQAKDQAARPSGGPRGRKQFVKLAFLVALSAGCVALGWWLRTAVVNDRSVLRVTRSAWPLPKGLGLDSPPIVSPDGQHVAFTASSGGTIRRLFVRPFSSLEARAIAGTEGARHPFWSPDARSLGYFVPGRLMKVAIDGGAPVEVCAAREGRGGAWSSTGVIIFSPHLIDFGLSRVSADGGAVEPATLLDTAQGENSHRWPVFLPDGIHFLYFVRSIRAERRGVYLGRVDRAAAVPGAALFRSESEALYAPLDRAGRGVLLSPANGHLEVRPFDARQQRLSGDPTTIDIPVPGITLYHPSMFSVSDDVLAYVPSPIPYGQRLALIERQGENLKLWEERAPINWPRLSPDGRRLAYQRIDAIAGSLDLWGEDLERGSRLRLTKDGAAGLLPVWAPDGRRMAYLTGTVGKATVVIAAADGTGIISTLPCPGTYCFPTDWSPDGHWLVANVQGPARADVWRLSTVSGGTSRPLLAESFVERDARLSPDGRLVAYVSEESGHPELAVQTVDGPPARDVLSVGGGDQPVWSRDGRELFFVDPQGSLRSVTVGRAPDGRPVFGRAVRLDVPRIGSGHWGTQYDVSPDGRRIYFLDRQIDPPPSEISVVIGWRALLK
ncbi:MAG TPA: protein kinase [Vicinamibacterales bacterium]|nr:protein kinase [Vicinamibacterales bacterium]